jgi:sn-glycerol 3-phosphate transport system substrate-binding protein
MMMMKTFLAALALAAVAVPLSAQAQQRTKFEFWYGLTGRLGEVVEQHCGRFNASQDKFEAVCIGQGGYDKAEQNTIAAYRSKQQPTVVQIYDAGTVNFMLSGAIYPATQFAKDFGIAVDWNDYFSGISNYYATSKGEMWSFPYNSSSALLYWNKTAWAKIGKSKAPETVEDWFDDLRKMKAAGVECGFGFDYDTWVAMEQFSAVHNIPLATRSNGYAGLDAELVFNKTKFVDYMKDWKKLLDEGVARIQTAQTGKTIVQAFSDGTCASILTSVADHGNVGATAVPGLEWGVAMLPVYKDFTRHNSLVGGASLWIMQGKSKEEYEGAAALMKFLIQPTESLWFSTVTGYIPVTNTGFDYMRKNGFYEIPKNMGRETAIKSLTFTPPSENTRGIRLGNYTQIRAEVRAELEAAFTGKKDVQTAIDDAANRSNQILRRFEQTFKGKTLP